MTKITPPAVYTYHGPTPEDWGVSGFVIIAESHISVHTFPDRGYVNIDVFSCKEFDTDDAMAQVGEFFTMAEVRNWVLERRSGAPRPRNRQGSRGGRAGDRPPARLVATGEPP